MQLLPCQTVVGQISSGDILTGAIAALGIIVSYFVNRHTNGKQLKALEKQTEVSNDQTKATLELECLKTYFEISKLGKEAIISKNKEYAEQYWVSLIDLMWSEYQMWKNNLIPDEVMASWCYSRRNNFGKNKNNKSASIFLGNSEIERDNVANHVYYEDTWNVLLEHNYFRPGTGFRKLMKEIHKDYEKEIEDILKEHKEWIKNHSSK